MTILHLCLLIVALLPFPWTLIAKLGGRYNNHAPRAYLAALDGWRARAHAAHQNAWEALALFTAAVLVAGQAGEATTWINTLAVTYVVMRVLHGVLYLLDWASLRSLVWFVGLGCVIALFVAGVR
ncbi:MAPEG family protein [Paraburkholderia bonniea]|uniref:MAPEG family protein n=1 Tax=Paraburkholderia bonniea TaxID=2152891 RepID=UPI0012929C94|nr:MAPEG family protein [Paraburkholderia bonniea]WJF88914.1 MAPEG family protein [Paraburkholderia bonniea]WJF92230.1 MAPEG family protein [Paraburkholderia bonniea]